MTCGLIRVTKCEIYPESGNWVVHRSWWQNGHPLSGLTWSAEIPDTKGMTEDQMLTAIKKANSDSLADRQLLEGWSFDGQLKH